MSIKNILFLAAFAAFLPVSAQMLKKPAVITGQTVFDSTMKDPILLSVGGDPVTKSEFEAIYHKNNNKETLTKEDLNEYLGLFVNFKLKVKAARDAGKDTLEAFKSELKGYRRQLAQPYLTDKEVNEKLI
jgi:peptidyl-prolyl cis-trans isomerase SurA